MDDSSSLTSLSDDEENKQIFPHLGSGIMNEDMWFVFTHLFMADIYYDLDDGFIDDGDLEDSCYNNGLYGMDMRDEFEGVHDMEDDDM